jgi:signal peptidase II
MGSRKFGFAVAALVFLADQLTKWLVTGPLGINAIGDQLAIIPIFNLTYTENFGISLGLFQANSATGQWVLIALTGAIAAGVAYWIGRETQRFDQAALGMVLGGALGNILDRARFGHVVDFADLHFAGIPPAMCLSYENGLCRPFLIFNVADAAISIAVVIMLLRAFLPGKDKVEGQEPRETIDHA